jgi:uncharacterized membrane protein
MPGLPFGVSHGFHWRDGRFTDLPPLTSYLTSSVSDISALGVLVGSSRSQLGANTAVIWVEGNAVDYNSFVSTSGAAYLLSLSAVSDTGIVIGISQLAGVVAVILEPSKSSIADINSNCQVNIDDLLAVIRSWGETNTNSK